ncbi:diguanylate cyclase [Scytonema sp. UIC 10036]|nr:diguanylate cyclase [Scytonema sp. UIC 10036]MUH01409.1 diguanylate cyclase [Scytonema sp. UIC 10036]
MTLFHPEDCLILVVDDVSKNLQVIVEILQTKDYEATVASSGQQALERVKAAKPDLILLDLMMPEMNGLEVCEKLKADPEFAEIPIIFLTASTEQEHILQAFEKGAVDYVTKPFHAPELLARVRTHLELKYAREQLKKLLHEQKEFIQELERLATIDPLTQVFNRRHLFALAEQELNRSQRYSSIFSVLILDIDHFKQINDIYGHAVGDRVLTSMAQTVLNCLRTVDFFGRFGGEEFVAFLPERDIDVAITVAERIRENLEKTAILVQEQQIFITVSIGVASYNLADETVDVIIQRADKALYHAKNQGRNRVVAAPNF